MVLFRNIGRLGEKVAKIIERKIGQVFVAMLDPDPRNNGLGIQILQSVGIRVVVGLLEDEAHKDLDQYVALSANNPLS